MQACKDAVGTTIAPLTGAVRTERRTTMDCSKLIRDAWAATWRYRFLWVLGLFAWGTASAVALRIATGAALALLLIPIVVAAAASAVVFGIVATYAQRAIADEGPVAALGDGWQLFRRNAGASVLVWMVNVALSIGAGIAASVAIGGRSRSSAWSGWPSGWPWARA
jgi:hypothetical protein